MDLWTVVLCLAFFVIAVFYASVGFGGGSSYLAVLSIAVFAVPFNQIKIIALICNVLVVSGSSLRYYKMGFINFQKIWPLLFISIPAAFLGSKLQLSERTFFICLGFSLILTGIILWFQDKIIRQSAGLEPRKNSLGISALLGGCIGAFSGMVGIGGGIFLSPVLFFLHWDKAKNIAATASVFILVNSVSSLFSMSESVLKDMSTSLAVGLGTSVILGGWIGSTLMSKRFDAVIIQKVTAVLICVASLNILYKYL